MPYKLTELIKLHLWDLTEAIYDILYFVRTQKLITALAGPCYERSRDLIEIDITYACNLLCFKCNRSCGLAPSDDHMSLWQIRKFIQESSSRDLQWRRIRVCGGEPALHPQFLHIMDELLAFRRSRCPVATIEVITNGFGKKVDDVLARIGSGIIVRNTAKKSRNQDFAPFNMAPGDFARYSHSDFSCGCLIPSKCGMGLSPYGYYQCAIAASIDRVFGFDIGRKSLPYLSDPMRDQMEALCRYCGHFMTFRRTVIENDKISESWRKGYDAYKVSKPRMTLY